VCVCVCVCVCVTVLLYPSVVDLSPYDYIWAFRGRSKMFVDGSLRPSTAKSCLKRRVPTRKRHKTSTSNNILRQRDTKRRQILQNTTKKMRNSCKETEKDDKEIRHNKKMKIDASQLHCKKKTRKKKVK